MHLQPPYRMTAQQWRALVRSTTERIGLPELGPISRRIANKKWRLSNGRLERAGKLVPAK